MPRWFTQRWTSAQRLPLVTCTENCAVALDWLPALSVADADSVCAPVPNAARYRDQATARAALEEPRPRAQH